MVTEEGGALYILDRNNDILMGYNEKYQKQLKELGEQESVKEISEKEIITGNLEDDFYYIAGELENASNKLVYLVPRETFLKENRKILQHILEMVLLVIGFTVCTMLYFSRRLARPLVEVAQTLEKAPNGMAVLEEPRGSFKEMSKFVSCYNQAGKKIEELLEKVERESRLKEKAHYEMLMSQISPHFIFNTVNSIRIMAIKEGQDRAGGNENTEKALEALGDILHAVYSNKNGMTTVGQETALLKAYVDIMQMRFGSSFQYYNVIPTELFYYEIPAFTMQPIVENAIQHGVKGVTAVQILVSAIEYENDFVISVFNNGNSADKKKIEDLLKGEKNQRAVTGIGLYNVNSSAEEASILTCCARNGASSRAIVRAPCSLSRSILSGRIGSCSERRRRNLPSPCALSRFSRTPSQLSGAMLQPGCSFAYSARESSTAVPAARKSSARIFSRNSRLSTGS